VTEPIPSPAGQRHDADTAREAVRVVYIAGSGRSGSTLVDSVLGQQPGVRSAGEVRYLWQRGVIDDRACGCGEPFSRCPEWQQVMASLPAPVDPLTMVRAEDAHTRIRSLPGLLWRRSRRHPLGEDLGDTLTAVYRAIRDVADAAVVVDSSKLPPYGLLLDDCEDVTLRVVHVVRDPRATAYSWTRTKELPDFGDRRFMQRLPVWKAAALWLLWNVTVDAAWRRRALRVRYEDFVADPLREAHRIGDFAGLAVSSDWYRPGPEVMLSPTHSVAGNPSRHRTGWVPVRSDDEWVTRLPRRQAWLVTAITWPLLLRYRYPLRPRAVKAR
jgi:hypothetical protein